MPFAATPAKKRITIAILIYILWVVAFAYFSFKQEKNRICELIDQQLEAAALTAPLLLPDNLHRQTMQKSDVSPEQNYQNILALSELTDLINVVDVFTLILKDNKIFFTSSSATIEERNTGEKLTSYFDHYDDADPHVFDIFASEQTTFLEYTDHWGNFRSIFIPHYSADGTLYLAAADIKANHINQLLKQNLYQTLTIALLFVLFAYPLYLVSTIYISRKAANLEQQLQLKTQELSKNQQRLEQALHSAKQAWFEMNVQTGKVKVGNEYLEILGFYNPDKRQTFDSSLEIWQNNIHPDDRQQAMQILQRSINDVKNDTPVSMEFRRKTADGQWIWIHSTGKAIERDQYGNPLFIVGINRDITKRKRRELVLQTLAETNISADGDIFKTIVRQLALSHNMRYVLIATINAAKTQLTTRALWSNGQFTSNVSYELAGAPCADVISRKANLYPNNIQKRFPEDQMLVDMDAESYIGVPLVNERDEVLGLLAMIDDKPMVEDDNTLSLLHSLAVRTTIELERREKDDKLRLFSYIFRDTHENILLVDNNDLIIDANPAFCLGTGYEKDELMGRSIQIFQATAHQYPPSFYNDIKKSIAKNGSWQGQLWSKIKNGNEILTEVVTTQITNSADNLIYRFMLVNDITEKQRQQDALKFMAHYGTVASQKKSPFFIL